MKRHLVGMRVTKRCAACGNSYRVGGRLVCRLRECVELAPSSAVQGRLL